MLLLMSPLIILQTNNEEPKLCSKSYAYLDNELNDAALIHFTQLKKLTLGYRNFFLL